MSERRFGLKQRLTSLYLAQPWAGRQGDLDWACSGGFPRDAIVHRQDVDGVCQHPNKLLFCSPDGLLRVAWAWSKKVR
jgi:hypothetical protein